MRKIVSFLIIFLVVSLYSLDYVIGQDGVESAISRINTGSLSQRLESGSILIKTHTARSTEGLISALNNQYGRVRLLAVVELSKRGVLSSPTSQRAVEGLVSAITNDDKNVRYLALEGLKKSNSERATEGIISGLNSTDSTMQMEAVKGLTEDIQGNINKSRAVEGLIQALDSPSVIVRKKALYGLFISKTERARNGLEKALSDSNREVSGLARRYLHY